MAGRLLVDTDVLIDYLRAVPAAVAWLESREEPLLVSAVTIAELFSGVRESERSAVEAFLTAFEVIPLDRTIAERGGLLRRDWSRSHGTGLPDAMIAASAEHAGATLVSLNRRHFPPPIDVLVPYRKESGSG